MNKKWKDKYWIKILIGGRSNTNALEYSWFIEKEGILE